MNPPGAALFPIPNPCGAAGKSFQSKFLEIISLEKPKLSLEMAGVKMRITRRRIY